MSEQQSGDYVQVPRWAVVAILDSMDGPCVLDHHGYCQAHTLGDPCFVPALRDALFGSSEHR